MEAYITAHEHDLNLIELVVVAVVGGVFCIDVVAVSACLHKIISQARGNRIVNFVQFKCV